MIDNRDYFLDMRIAGIGEGIAPCVVLAASADKCQVLLADGHDTGVPFDVPITAVSYADGKMIHDAQKELFR